MSTLRSLKLFISQRLSAAVAEVVGRLEVAITEYEEEVESRQLRLLHAASGAADERPTAVFSARVQQQLVIKEEALSEQQEWGSSLDQQDPGQPHIGEEKQHFWTSLEASSRLPCLHEEDFTKFPSMHVPVKSEDEETSQSPRLDQRQFGLNREAEPPVSSSAPHVKKEPDEEDRRGPEPDRILVSGFNCLSESTDKPLCSSEAQTEDSDVCWKGIGKPQTDLNTVKSKVPVNDMDSNSDNKLFSCSKCGKRFGQKHHLQTHMRCHTGEKPFTCSLCGKRFSVKGNLKQHMVVHTRERSCSCTICGELFSHKGNLTQHMTVHTRENLDRTAFMTKDSVNGLLKTGE
ncbi:putative myeloid zinc finger 1-like [Scophthalmus maximus]|uniref:Putative myeloid zinc finger 1-like n=1 Tax=Scophthalmus maximus TaxID=52904 RepID=A0A2U9BLX4_SCOMX|nr:putative myeloid zinc finger 1-like [Scophthalmus maximus]